MATLRPAAAKKKGEPRKMGNVAVGRTGDAVDLAREFARRPAATCDPGGLRVTLFGSRARGAADEESDLDLFVEVQGDDASAIKMATDRIAGDMTLEHAILVSVFVADPAFMNARRGYSFLEAVAAEGIPIEREEIRELVFRDRSEADYGSVFPSREAVERRLEATAFVAAVAELVTREGFDV